MKPNKRQKRAKAIRPARKGGQIADAFVLANRHLRVAMSSESKGGLNRLVDVATRQNFILPGKRPLYRLVLSREGRDPMTVSALDATDFRFGILSSSQGESAALTYCTHRKLALDVTCRVMLDKDSRLSRWRIAISNRTEYAVRAIHFPIIVALPNLGKNGEDDVYVSGAGYGLIARNPGKMLLGKKTPAPEPPEPGIEELGKQFCQSVYPGPIFVQMHTYYDSTAGIYIAAHDSGANLKSLRYAAAEGEEGIDLSLVHYYDETPSLSFELPYDIVLGTFRGDWYDAADIYKEWAHKQHWCARKLSERDDVPAWFKEPRPHLMVISRGGVDRAQATLPCPPSEFPLGKFWPARKLPPIMDRYAKALGSPVIVWLEGWEKIGSPGGPVEIFPPYEGGKSFKAAIQELNDAGHVVQLYLAAFHWCYRRPTTGYYGEDQFEREGRQLAAVNANGEIEKFVFPSGQKHAVNLCVGCDQVQELYRENFRKLLDYGATWLQLDQQGGLYTPVCYSRDHGHPAGYGPWMYRSMLEFTRRIRADARRRNPRAAYTCESACEVWIQEIDAFMNRPYLCGDVIEALPLFEYIYHEYAITYGGDVCMWLAHRDAACLKHAMCCIYGMQNLISIGEPDYDIDVEEAKHPGIPLLKEIIAAQRTYARDYLVLGQMKHPIPVEVQSIPIEFWWPPTAPTIRMMFKQVPLIVHGSWQAQDGRVGHVLVNWSGEEVEAEVSLGDANRSITKVTSGGRQAVPRKRLTKDRLQVSLRPRSVMLLEQAL
ncbi:MAG: hypothetical protein HY706_11925 [Candidatus Hydrogenedentes bacterium]|nr:hypothetical protein [Candidatus Hydrogenedentota bacterium]